MWSTLKSKYPGVMQAIQKQRTKPHLTLIEFTGYNKCHQKKQFTSQLTLPKTYVQKKGEKGLLKKFHPSDRKENKKVKGATLQQISVHLWLCLRHDAKLSPVSQACNLKGIHQQKCLATSYSKIFCNGLCIIKEEDNLRKSTDIELIILAVFFN